MTPIRNGVPGSGDGSTGLLGGGWSPRAHVLRSSGFVGQCDDGGPVGNVAGSRRLAVSGRSAIPNPAVWSQVGSLCGGVLGGPVPPLSTGEVIVDGGCTVAYDKLSGELIWKTEAYRPGYGSAVSFSYEG